MDNKKDDTDQFIGGSRNQVNNIQAEQHGQFIRDAIKQSEEQPVPVI